MTNQNQQDDKQKDKKDEQKQQQPLSVAVSATPESAPISVERQSAPKSELSGELLAPLESAKERPENQPKERPEQQPADKGEYTEKSKSASQTGGDYAVPQVFGYKVPPKLATNPKFVSKMRKRGNPNNGIVSLYIFLDRLFRMKPSTS
jgi:hypothetical protein